MTFSPIPWATLREATTAPALRAAAAGATQEQLILFHQRVKEAAEQLVRAHGIPWPGAVWLVTQGKRSWYAATKDASQVPTVLPPDAWSALDVIEDVYRERFGRETPPIEPAPVGAYVYDPAWEAKFWEIMDILPVGVPFEEAVAGLTRTELERLQAVATEVATRVEAYVEKHWGPEPSGFDWTWWAGWMPVLGKEVYDGLANPRAHHRRESARVP
jgi:hypothetical protein